MSLNSGSHSIRTALIIAVGIIIATKAATLATPGAAAALLCSALLLAFVVLAQELNVRQPGQAGSRRPGLALLAVLTLSSLIIALVNPSAMPRLLPVLGVAAWLASLPRRGQRPKTEETVPC
ncbi:MAG: hypothetical protein KDI60_20645 [Xanthomonadales bacterium]|nr:hypothetical protein [Xanthomonadales bacterium]